MNDVEDQARQICHDVIDMDLARAQKLVLDAGFTVRVKHFKSQQIFTQEIKHDRINLYVGMTDIVISATAG